MTVVIASRLCSAAGIGEVLVQGVVESLVASRDGLALEAASEYELKGVPDPVRASRLIWRKLAGDMEASAGLDMTQTPALSKGTSKGDEVLCIGLLGAFSVRVGDNVVADDAWRLRKAKTLIKLLALAPERRLHVERGRRVAVGGAGPGLRPQQPPSGDIRGPTCARLDRVGRWPLPGAARRTDPAESGGPGPDRRGRLRRAGRRGPRAGRAWRLPLGARGLRRRAAAGGSLRGLEPGAARLARRAPPRPGG